jgi:hypothetical protein
LRVARSLHRAYLEQVWRGARRERQPQIIAELNKLLKNELTAINQYFLHARMMKHWGFERLAKKIMTIDRRNETRRRSHSASCSSKACPTCRTSAG